MIKKLELVHATTIEDLKETALYFGKDTRRKKLIFYKKWLTDLDYIIDHIEPQLKTKALAWHLGEQLSDRDLRGHKAEKELILKNFTELVK
jgi:hypothetical protein